MTQQTAVDWLLKNIHVVPKFELSAQDIIKQAKQMEKEQSEQAHLDGYKKAWSEANEELQKYVDSVNKYSFLKK